MRCSSFTRCVVVAAMPAALAFQSALTLHLPGRSATLSEYRARLEHLLHPAT